MTEFENAEQQLLHEGQLVTVLHGVSMWPMIRCRKDPVLIRPLKDVRPTTACIGDVVVFRLPDRYVVHRVIRVDADHYVIRGDNCLGVEIVPHSEVVGIVTQWWRNGKEHSVSDRGYRMYVALWMAVHPLYRFLKRTKAKTRAALSRLKHAQRI